MSFNNQYSCDGGVGGSGVCLGAHLSGLIVDLQGQFSGGRKDQGEWVLLTSAVPAVLLRDRKKKKRVNASNGNIRFVLIIISLQYLSVLGSLQGISRTFSVDLTQHRQQEGSGLTRTWDTAGIRDHEKNQKIPVQTDGERRYWPVWAQAIRSLLDLMMGMACFCTGVGRV